MNTHIPTIPLWKPLANYEWLSVKKKGMPPFSCIRSSIALMGSLHKWLRHIFVPLHFVKQHFCWTDSSRVCLSVISCCVSSGEGVSRKGSGGAGASSHSQVPGVWISTALFPLVPWGWTPNLQHSRETQTRYCPHSYKHVQMTSTGSLKTS